MQGTRANSHGAWGTSVTRWKIKDFLDATPFGMGKVLTRGLRSRAPPRPMGL